MCTVKLTRPAPPGVRRGAVACRVDVQVCRYLHPCACARELAGVAEVCLISLGYLCSLEYPASWPALDS